MNSRSRTFNLIFDSYLINFNAVAKAFLRKTFLMILLFLLAKSIFIGASPNYLNSILQSTENTIDKNYNRLSSATRLLVDDPANYAIYEKLTANIRQLEKEISNNSDMISYYKSAEGYLENIIDVLQRIRELSLQKSNGILSDFDKDIINFEINHQYEQILFVLKNADFNKKNIFRSLLEDEEIKRWFRKEEYYQLSNIDNLLFFFIRQRSIYGAKMKSLEYQNQGKSIEKENMACFSSNIHDINYADELSKLRRNHLLLTMNLLMLGEVR